jgi:5-methylcytosine-specific restriction endonuclease McrA
MLDGRPPWGGRLAAELTAECLAVKGTVCHLCGLAGATTADHVTPRSKGGPDALDNLEPAHRACNSARGDRTLAEWFAQRPRTYATQTAPSREW